MLTTTIALLAAFSGPMQAGPSAGSDQLLLVADSAHTLFTPNAPDPGRAGQVYQLPQGSCGVAVPNGNTASFIGSGGRIGIAPTPNCRPRGQRQANGGKRGSGVKKT